MQIQRAKLLDSLKLVLSGTGDDQNWDAAVFHGGWLSSYNDTISVSAAVEDLAGLNAVVKIRELQKLVQKLKGDLIDITDESDRIILDCGPTHAELAKFPDAISNYIGALALDKIQWKSVPENFGSMLALCRLDNHKHKRPVVHVSGVDVLADEAIRSNYGTLSASMDTFSIHTATAKELLAMGGLTSYALSDPWLHVFTASGVIFSAKVVTEPYPLSLILGLKKTAENLVPAFSVPMPTGLAEAVERVETFAVASSTGALGIEVQITPEAMILRTSKEAGNVSEKIFWDSALPEDTDIKFEASVPYLKEAAKRVQEFSVVMFPTRPKVDGVQPSEWPTVLIPRLVFRGPEFMQVVMVASK